MKRIFVTGLAVAVASVFGSADAHGQERPITFGVSAGVSLPLGDHFSEEAGTGFHVQGSLGYGAATLPVRFRADLLYHQFPDEHEGNFRQIGGLANALVGLSDLAGRPYLLGGLGFLNHSAPDEDHGDHSHEGDDETTFAFTVGAGVEFPIGGVIGTLEARFLAPGEEHRSIPISVGIRF